MHRCQNRLPRTFTGQIFQFRASRCSGASREEGPRLVALPARGAGPARPVQSGRGAEPAPGHVLSSALAAEGKRAGRSSRGGAGGGHRSRPFPRPAEDAVLVGRVLGLLQDPPELFAPRLLGWPRPGAGRRLQEGERRKRRRHLRRGRPGPALRERPAASAGRGPRAPVPGPGEREGRPYLDVPAASQVQRLEEGGRRGDAARAAALRPVAEGSPVRPSVLPPLASHAPPAPAPASREPGRAAAASGRPAKREAQTPPPKWPWGDTQKGGLWVRPGRALACRKESSPREASRLTQLQGGRAKWAAPLVPPPPGAEHNSPA